MLVEEGKLEIGLVY